MKFEALIQKIEKGVTLTPAEEDRLYRMLGLKGQIWRIIFYLLVIASGIAIIVISLGNNVISSDKNFYFMLAGALVVTYGLFKFFVRNQTEKIVLYFAAVDRYFDFRFHKYAGFMNQYADYKPLVTNSYLEKSRVHFLTDGYNFVIYDDILKDTKYRLPRVFRNAKANSPMMRIYDEESINKNRVAFEVTDIKNFRLRGDRLTETEFKKKRTPLSFLAYIFSGQGILCLFTRNIISAIWKYSPYTVTKTTINDYRYTILVLKDETTFKFGPEVYEILLETIPQKEVSC